MTAMILATEGNYLCNYGPFPYFLFKYTDASLDVFEFWVWFGFVVWGFLESVCGILERSLFYQFLNGI